LHRFQNFSGCACFHSQVRTQESEEQMKGSEP
jgi:hypothetical protein